MGVKESITPEMLVRYQEQVEPKKKLRKKASRGMLVFFLICVVIGGFVGFFGAKFLIEGKLNLELEVPFPMKEGFEFIYVIALLLGYFVTAVLHTVIHEGGHLVFGLMTGYEFLSFRIFSFTIVKKDGKLIRKKIKVAGTLGQCLMNPPEWDDNKPYPYVWYNLGGGIMNLLFCLLAVPLFFIDNSLLFWIAVEYVFCGVIFAITNLIPMSLGMPNDGKNCLVCGKNQANRKALYLQLKLNAMMSDGMEIKEIPDELLKIEDASPNILTCFVDMMQYYKYLHKQEEEEAERCLASIEEHAEKLPLAFVNTVEAERLFRMVRAKAPIEDLAVYYAVLQPVLMQITDLSILRIKYAYYLLLSDEERETIAWITSSKKGKLAKKLPKRKAVITPEKVWEEMEKAFAKHPVVGEAKFYMEQARECREQKEMSEQSVESINEENEN